MQAGLNEGANGIAKLLSNRYGDGQIYVPKAASRGILRAAINQGFVSEDGYLTRKGRNFLATARPTNLRG